MNDLYTSPIEEDFEEVGKDAMTFLKDKRWESLVDLLEDPEARKIQKEQYARRGVKDFIQYHTAPNSKRVVQRFILLDGTLDAPDPRIVGEVMTMTSIAWKTRKELIARAMAK